MFGNGEPEVLLSLNHLQKIHSELYGANKHYWRSSSNV